MSLGKTSLELEIFKWGLMWCAQIFKRVKQRGPICRVNCWHKHKTSFDRSWKHGFCCNLNFWLFIKKYSSFGPLLYVRAQFQISQTSVVGIIQGRQPFELVKIDDWMGFNLSFMSSFPCTFSLPLFSFYWFVLTGLDFNSTISNIYSPNWSTAHRISFPFEPLLGCNDIYSFALFDGMGYFV